MRVKHYYRLERFREYFIKKILVFVFKKYVTFFIRNIIHHYNDTSKLKNAERMHWTTAFNENVIAQIVIKVKTSMDSLSDIASEVHIY